MKYWLLFIPITSCGNYTNTYKYFTIYNTFQTNSQPQDEEKEKEQLLKDLLKKLKKDEVADKVYTYIPLIHTYWSYKQVPTSVYLYMLQKEIKATGGGSYKPLLDDVGAQMLAIMGNQIEPLQNNCDSASNYYGHGK